MVYSRSRSRSGLSDLRQPASASWADDDADGLRCASGVAARVRTQHPPRRQHKHRARVHTQPRLALPAPALALPNHLTPNAPFLSRPSSGWPRAATRRRSRRRRSATTRSRDGSRSTVCCPHLLPLRVTWRSAPALAALQRPRRGSFLHKAPRPPVSLTPPRAVPSAPHHTLIPGDSFEPPRPAQPSSTSSRPPAGSPSTAASTSASLAPTAPSSCMTCPPARTSSRWTVSRPRPPQPNVIPSLHV